MIWPFPRKGFTFFPEMGFAVLTDATAGSIIGQPSVKLLDTHKLINKWKRNKTQIKTSHQTAASPLCLSKYLKNNKEYRDSVPTVPCLCILFILYLWPVLDPFTALLMVCLQSKLPLSLFTHNWIL